MNMSKDLFYTHQTLAVLFSVTNKLQMQGDKYLKDLTIRQMLAIPAIIHAPDGKVTFNYISKQLGTTKQNTKQIVDALVKKVTYLFPQANRINGQSMSLPHRGVRKPSDYAQNEQMNF